MYLPMLPAVFPTHPTHAHSVSIESYAPVFMPYLLCSFLNLYKI